MKKAVVIVNLVASTIILSLVALVVSLFKNRERLVQKIARLWSTMHLKVSGIQVSVTGLEKITKSPCILMCNHQSALDIYSLLHALPFFYVFIAKRQLFSIPFFGWAMKRGGYVSIDREKPREALRAIEDAATKIKNGMSILIFPEGTRSKDGVLLPFKKGVFSLALKAGVPVVPIGIRGSSRLQPKGKSFPLGKGVIYINMGDPIVTAEMTKSGKAGLMDRVRSEIERLMDVSS